MWFFHSGSAGVLLYGGQRKAYWLWNLKVEIRTWLAPWVGWSLPGSPAFLPFQSPTSFSTPLSFASDPTSSHFAFPPMQKMESLRPDSSLIFFICFCWKASSPVLVRLPFAPFLLNGGRSVLRIPSWRYFVAFPKPHPDWSKSVNVGPSPSVSSFCH